MNTCDGPEVTIRLQCFEASSAFSVSEYSLGDRSGGGGSSFHAASSRSSSSERGRSWSGGTIQP